MTSFEVTTTTANTAMFREAATRLGLVATDKAYSSTSTDKTVVKYADGREIPAATIIKLGRLVENMYVFKTDVNKLPEWTTLFSSKRSKIRSATTAV